MTILTEAVACNQCGSPNSDVIAHGTDREYYSSTDAYTIVQCRECGLVYLSPRPTSAELPHIYPRAYHSYILDDAAGSKDSFITKMRKRAGARRFRPIMQHIKGTEKVDLLDVGCGNGWLLQVIKSLDPERISTFGVEISEPVCEVARKQGHTIYCGRFEDVKLDRAFDVVNLTHVIEHVSDPRLAVRKAYEALNQGGLLLLETPNIGAIEWEWFKDGNWGAYHIPRHWFFFDRETIGSLGRAEGFTLIDWYCHPGPTHWVWTMHNVCAARTGRIAAFGERIFNPIRIFRGGGVPTIILGAFWILDETLLLLRNQTSVMSAIFRKN